MNCSSLDYPNHWYSGWYRQLGKGHRSLISRIIDRIASRIIFLEGFDLLTIVLWPISYPRKTSVCLFQSSFAKRLDQLFLIWWSTDEAGSSYFAFQSCGSFPVNNVSNCCFQEKFRRKSGVIMGDLYSHTKNVPILTHTLTKKDGHFHM